MATSAPIVPAPVPYCPATTMGVARFLARKAVKCQLQAQGWKLNHIEMRIITTQADSYLRDHPELAVEAVRMIARVPAFRKLAEQEAKHRAKAIQKTSLQQQANSSTAPRLPRALPAHTAIDRLSNRQGT